MSLITQKKEVEKLLILKMKITFCCVFATPEVDAQMREVGKKTTPYIKKLAVVGMAKGGKKILSQHLLK